MSSKPGSGPSPRTSKARPAPGPASGGGLEALSDAIESGAGLPAVARAAAAALGASIALIDRSSAVLAVAAASAAEEEKLIAAGADIERSELRVADAIVGELRIRARDEPVAPATVRTVATLLGLEVERARAPEWASDEVAHDFVADVLERRIADPADIAARAGELGADLDKGCGVVSVRARPRSAQPGEWRARLLMLGLRAAGSGALACSFQNDPGDPVVVSVVVPATEPGAIARVAAELGSSLAAAMSGFGIAVGYSRLADGPGELYRAGKEALMAVNVGEAEGASPLAFEDTGSYRLLLPAMSEDPGELISFFEETVKPLVAYDEQYETELVATIEAYLDNDGNVTPTAETLFTHRHTVRYRLERIRELSGHDLSSTAGREKLGLGLKAMRVLGIPSPRGPALEPSGRSRRPSREG